MLYLFWHCIAAHMGAVLWSTILHAVLSTAQAMQPLHHILEVELVVVFSMSLCPCHLSLNLNSFAVIA